MGWITSDMFSVVCLHSLSYCMLSSIFFLREKKKKKTQKLKKKDMLLPFSQKKATGHSEVCKTFTIYSKLVTWLNLHLTSMSTTKPKAWRAKIQLHTHKNRANMQKPSVLQFWGPHSERGNMTCLSHPFLGCMYKNISSPLLLLWCKEVFISVIEGMSTRHSKA